VSHRLQVLIPPELDAQLRKAAQRKRISKGEWVRRVLQESVSKSAKGRAKSGTLARLAALGAPTSDIDRMLSDIDAGRR
jgi:hypothetical protein